MLLREELQRRGLIKFGREEGVCVWGGGWRGAVRQSGRTSSQFLISLWLLRGRGHGGSSPRQAAGRGKGGAQRAGGSAACRGLLHGGGSQVDRVGAVLGVLALAQLGPAVVV